MNGERWTLENVQAGGPDYSRGGPPRPRGGRDRGSTERTTDRVSFPYKRFSVYVVFRSSGRESKVSGGRLKVDSKNHLAIDTRVHVVPAFDFLRRLVLVKRNTTEEIILCKVLFSFPRKVRHFVRYENSLVLQTRQTRERSFVPENFQKISVCTLWTRSSRGGRTKSRTILEVPHVLRRHRGTDWTPTPTVRVDTFLSRVSVVCDRYRPARIFVYNPTV